MRAVLRWVGSLVGVAVGLLTSALYFWEPSVAHYGKDLIAQQVAIQHGRLEMARYAYTNNGYRPHHHGGGTWWTVPGTTEYSSPDFDVCPDPSGQDRLVELRSFAGFHGGECEWSYASVGKGRRVWTRVHFVIIPLWPGWLFCLLPGAHLLAYLRRRRPVEGHCVKCDYDLRAHKPGDRCPECGTVVGPGHVPSVSP